MDWNKLFDNRIENERDFKLFMTDYLNGAKIIDKLIRMPLSNGKTRLTITKDDRLKFQENAKALIEGFEKICRDKGINAYDPHRPVIVNNENGLYFFPPFAYGTTKSQDKHRFVRIYLGLHSSKLIEFLKTFDDLAKGKDIFYNYKFFNVKDNSCDRAVIYPNNEDFFKALEIIDQIHRTKPQLFEGAVDKPFTTHLYQGIGASSDLGYTLSNTMSEFIDIFVSEILRQYPPNENQNRDAFFLDCLKKYYQENKEILQKQGFDDDYSVYQSQLNERFDYFVKNRYKLGFMPFIIKDNKGRVFQPEISISSVQAWIYPFPKATQQEIVDKLCDYSLFQKMLPEIIQDLPRVDPDVPSKQNISFLSHEIGILKQLKEKYDENIEEKDIQKGSLQLNQIMIY